MTELLCIAYSRKKFVLSSCLPILVLLTLALVVSLTSESMWPGILSWVVALAATALYAYKIAFATTVVEPGTGYVVMFAGAYRGVLWNAPGMVEILEEGNVGSSIVRRDQLFLLPSGEKGYRPGLQLEAFSPSAARGSRWMLYQRLDGSSVACRFVCVDKTPEPLFGNHYFIGLFKSIMELPAPFNNSCNMLRLEGISTQAGPQVNFTLAVQLRLVNLYRAIFENRNGLRDASNTLRMRMINLVGQSDPEALLRAALSLDQELTKGLESTYGIEVVTSGIMDASLKDPALSDMMSLAYKAKLAGEAKVINAVAERDAIVELAKGEASRLYSHSLAEAKRIEILAETLRKTGEEGEKALRYQTMREMKATNVFVGGLAEFFEKFANR